MFKSIITFFFGEPAHVVARRKAVTEAARVEALPFLIGQNKNGTTVYKSKSTGKFIKATHAQAYLNAL